MDFFRLKKFRKDHKPNQELVTEPVLHPEEPKKDGGDALGKSVNADSTNTENEDDDDDFITNEVKRRLKVLRQNSFMVLIPEETAPEDEDGGEEEEGETSSCEWRDVEAEGRQFWSGFDAVYDKYCERMLFFDRSSAQQLLEVGSCVLSTQSPRLASKKLPSPLRCLSLKKFEEPEDETEHLQKPESDPYQDLETAYVAQLCLTWEALHCQYTQLSHKISSQPESSTCYNHSAQQFQQFQVLLQRFIENEPFEHGLRPEIYARARNSLPKLLQVPKIQGSDEKRTGEEESDCVVLAPDLIRIIECSILSFRQFMKMDKKKLGGFRNLFGSQNQRATPLQQIQSSHEKKELKLKEQWKRTKSYKKKSWPSTQEGTEMLLGLIDAKIVSRVLQMAKISNEQLFWCEEKMKKLAISDGKLQRDPSPILFPC
ncbi:Gb:, isoform 1 [Olea europaea subsp. europaea]|uniref:Gb:, isoform 1 n=1 Tax=Olea europaea subsp. europaea TaxID=158383 RepID=A0A8S0UW18_OLEEU|nr:Gb:, isoform 1 [Olea europaea subsp. europaea]